MRTMFEDGQCIFNSQGCPTKGNIVGTFYYVCILCRSVSQKREATSLIDPRKRNAVASIVNLVVIRSASVSLPTCLNFVLPFLI